MNYGADKIHWEGGRKHERDNFSTQTNVILVREKKNAAMVASQEAIVRKRQRMSKIGRLATL